MLDPIFETFRTFLQGYKTYLTAIFGGIAALIAFANGEYDIATFIAALTGALGLAPQRAAIKTEVKKVLGE